jgi:hypothetical protein
MATKKIASSQDIYQIKVTLLGTKPPIWRRLLFRSSLTLAQRLWCKYRGRVAHKIPEQSDRTGSPGD